MTVSGKLSASRPISIGNGTIVQSATIEKQAFAASSIDIRNNVRFVLAQPNSYCYRASEYRSGSLFVDDNAEVYVTQATPCNSGSLITVKKSTVVAI